MKSAEECFNDITGHLRNKCGLDDSKIKVVAAMLNAFWDAADSEARKNALPK